MVKINPLYRKKIILGISVIYLSGITSSFFMKDPYYWAICTGLCFFSYNSGMANVLAILNETFDDDTKKYIFIYVWESFTITGIMISIVTYIF